MSNKHTENCMLILIDKVNHRNESNALVVQTIQRIQTEHKNIAHITYTLKYGDVCRIICINLLDLWSYISITIV